MTAPRPGTEREPWTGFWGAMKRLATNHIKVVVTAFLAGIVGVSLVPWMVGVVLLPRTVRAQGVQLQNLDGTVDRLISSNDSLKRVTALDVAYQCIDADSARFAASWETCGEAMFISRLDPTYWRGIMMGKGFRATDPRLPVIRPLPPPILRR